MEEVKIDPELYTSRNRRVQVKRATFNKLRSRFEDLIEYIATLEKRIDKLEKAKPTKAKQKKD